VQLRSQLCCLCGSGKLCSVMCFLILIQQRTWVPLISAALSSCHALKLTRHPQDSDPCMHACQPGHNHLQYRLLGSMLQRLQDTRCWQALDRSPTTARADTRTNSTAHELAGGWPLLHLLLGMAADTHSWQQTPST
jgi:hypothetical protein